MKRKLGLSALFAILALSGFAQEVTPLSDEEPTSERKAYHYIGIQANQLLRQLFSLGAGAGAIDNPYLLNYAVNSAANGAGINASFGYTLLETNDVQTQFTRESKDNNMFFRLGFDKKSTLGKRWLLSAGIDLVIDSQNSNVKGITNNGGGSSSVVETDVKTSGTGLGPRVSLHFKVSEKIYLGTEANYYYKSFKTTNSSSFSFDPNGGITNTVKFKRFQLNVPAVIYLTIKL